MACWVALTQGLSQAVIKVLTRAAVTSRLNVGWVSLQAHSCGCCHICVLAVDRDFSSLPYGPFHGVSHGIESGVIV